MEHYDQAAGIEYRNICIEYGLQVPKSRWEILPRGVKNERAKILCGFLIQTDKLVMTNQLDIVVADKFLKKAVVIDIAMPCKKTSRRRKEDKKLEKYQGLKGEMKKMWKVKATVVPVVI